MIGVDWAATSESFAALAVIAEEAIRPLLAMRAQMKYRFGKWQREAAKRYPGAPISGSGRYGVIEMRQGVLYTVALFRTASQTKGMVEMLRAEEFRNRTYTFEDFGDPLIAALDERFEQVA